MIGNKFSSKNQDYSYPKSIVEDITPADDAFHGSPKRLASEWWYFDARLENGYTVVGFFRAKHQQTGKTGVEIAIYKPNGEKIQTVIDYHRSDFKASLLIMLYFLSELLIFLFLFLKI